MDIISFFQSLFLSSVLKLRKLIFCLAFEVTHAIESLNKMIPPQIKKKIQSKMSCSVNIMRAYCKKKKNAPQPLFPIPYQHISNGLVICG